MPSRPYAIALEFVRYDQPTAGLAPLTVLPYWATQKNPSITKLRRGLKLNYFELSKNILPFEQHF